jgi:Zn ribbon nucleic-acid-binding protein
MMIWLRACPRCETGDLVLGKDIYGSYMECLQCGYMKDQEEPEPDTATPVQRRDRLSATSEDRVAAGF